MFGSHGGRPWPLGLGAAGGRGPSFIVAPISPEALWAQASGSSDSPPSMRPPTLSPGILGFAQHGRAGRTVVLKAAPTLKMQELPGSSPPPRDGAVPVGPSIFFSKQTQKALVTVISSL